MAETYVKFSEIVQVQIKRRQEKQREYKCGTSRDKRRAPPLFKVDKRRFFEVKKCFDITIRRINPAPINLKSMPNIVYPRA